MANWNDVRRFVGMLAVTWLTFLSPTIPVTWASHGGIHAIFESGSLESPTYGQQLEARPGDEFWLIIKADADFGPTQVSLGNLPLAATIVLASDGPWQLVKLSPESPTPIDALEFDSTQTDAVPMIVRIREDAISGVYGLLDARVNVTRATSLAPAAATPEPTTAPLQLALPAWRPGAPRSDASEPPPRYVSHLDMELPPGWLIVQCYCWRGEGIALPSMNLRESRGDWSYTFTPDLGKPVIFTDLPTDVALVLELDQKAGVFPGQPTRWDEIYLATRGTVVYFVVGP